MLLNDNPIVALSQINRISIEGNGIGINLNIIGSNPVINRWLFVWSTLYIKIFFIIIPL